MNPLSFNQSCPDEAQIDTLAEEAEMIKGDEPYTDNSVAATQSTAAPSELQTALADLVAAEDRVIAAIAANPKEVVRRYVELRVVNHGRRIDSAVTAALYTPDAFGSA